MSRWPGPSPRKPASRSRTVTSTRRLSRRSTSSRGRSHLLLKRLAPDEPAHRDVELIQKATDRATAMTAQLLAFSRKQVLEPRSLDLNALVEELAPVLARLIGAEIELVILPGMGLGRVMADPGQIEQVIMNLLVNSRD